MENLNDNPISAELVAFLASSSRAAGTDPALLLYYHSLVSELGLHVVARDLVMSLPERLQGCPDQAVREVRGCIQDFCTQGQYRGGWVGPAFRKPEGALTDYFNRRRQRSKQAFVETSISKQVFEALDFCLDGGRMVLVEGDSGVGKTESARAWFDQNRGVARYIRLQALNTRQIFFHTLAKGLGLPCTRGLSADAMQISVQEFLHQTGVILLLDEAQYLWPQGESIKRHPAFVNWLNTALINEGIRVALVTTSEFSERRKTVEAQTSWQSFQLRRRIARAFVLPDAPSEDDIRKVAAARLPEATAAMLNGIVQYACLSKGYLQCAVDLIDNARRRAKSHGRDRVLADDLKETILEIQGPSDAALKRVFSAHKPGRGRVTADELQERGRGAAVEKDLADQESAGGRNRLAVSPVLAAAER